MNFQFPTRPNGHSSGRMSQTLQLYSKWYITLYMLYESNLDILSPKTVLLFFKTNLLAEFENLNIENSLKIVN